MTVVPASWQATQHELAGKTILITGAGDGIGKQSPLPVHDTVRRYSYWAAPKKN